jgi:hypothetical protein
MRDYWKNSRTKYCKQESLFVAKWIETILNQEKDLIIKPLERVYQAKFPFSQIKVYMTTIPICPYNYSQRWFMVLKQSKITSFIKTALHELNHFMFIYYYQQKLESKNFNPNHIHFVREALAILTSWDGVENDNKPKIQELQKYIYSLHRYNIENIIDLALKQKSLFL